MKIQCALCDCELPAKGSGWGVYFDPEFRTNIWGGDTYQDKAYLCQDCGEQLAAKAGLEEDAVH